VARDGLGIIEQASDTEPLAASLDGNDGVYFVPALTGSARRTGIRTPGDHRRPHPRLEPGASGPRHARVDRLPDRGRHRAQNTALGTPLAELRADGGATDNAWLMQFQADMLGVPGRRSRSHADHRARAPPISPASPRACGPKTTCGGLWKEARRYEPRMSDDQRQTLLADWRRALERSRRWVVEA
jgi:glycerol kinase